MNVRNVMNVAFTRSHAFISETTQRNNVFCVHRFRFLMPDSGPTAKKYVSLLIGFGDALSRQIIIVHLK